MKRQKSWRQKDWSVAPGLASFEAVSGFLQQSFGAEESVVYSPSDLRDMGQAIVRIQQAIETKERIMVFGDFDADGVTATVILVDALRRLGAEVSYRIPERDTDSHGLKKHLIDEIATTNTGLIITVDCGINDRGAVNYAVQKNIEVIITDHHQSDAQRFPDQALAVLNPQRPDCDYPGKNLSGAGVAFKLVQGLAQTYFSKTEALAFEEKYLDVLAIGLVADCMSLTGEVRTLVQRGLGKMPHTDWPGLAQLMQALRIEPDNLNEDTIGFYLGPVINAASRLGDVQQAVQLFLSHENSADRINYLLELNNQRKDWSQRASEAALSQINDKKPCQIIIAEDWPIGVLGLVAGRVVEKIQQPIVVLRLEGDHYKASCRAPKWADIETALRAKSDLFTNMGGHPAAAGFLMPIENLSAFKEHLVSYYQALEKPELAPSSAVPLAPEVIDLELVSLIETYAPFGLGRPGPTWLLENAKVIDLQWMGAEKQHVRLQLKAGDKVFTALFFRAAEYKDALVTDAELNVCFSLRRQLWRGEERLQLMVLDVT